MQRLDSPNEKNIEKLLEQAEALSTADSFSQTRTERIQQAIDAIDDQIDEPNYKLYETQALLYYAKGDILNAKRYIEDAFVLNDETATYSKTGRLLIKKLLADRKLQRADSDEKEPGANRLDRAVALASDSQESGQSFTLTILLIQTIL